MSGNIAQEAAQLPVLDREGRDHWPRRVAAGRSLLFGCRRLLNSIMELLVCSSTLWTTDIDAFALQYGLWWHDPKPSLNLRGADYNSANHTGWSCIRGRSVRFRARRKGAQPPARTKPSLWETATADRQQTSQAGLFKLSRIAGKELGGNEALCEGGYRLRLKHSWVWPGTGGGRKSTLMERRLAASRRQVT